MDSNLSQQFSLICEKFTNILYLRESNKTVINALVDDLNTKPYKGEVFVPKHDAIALISAICHNCKSLDEPLTVKISHLMNNVITKQKLLFTIDLLNDVVWWHMECLKRCSEIVILDILHNLQCILQMCPLSGFKFLDELIGPKGIIINLIDTHKFKSLNTGNLLQIHLTALKCIVCLITCDENKNNDSNSDILSNIKEHIALVVTKYLMNGSQKSYDEFLYCKVVITALRALTQVYYNDQNVAVLLPEVIGICRYYVLYGIVSQGTKPEKIMPAQQSIAMVPVPVVQNTKGGKKQKLRKQRNNAIESLKKEIPVSDRSLMKDVESFENSSAYKPASRNYLEHQKAGNFWTLTSDSDMSDVENSREAKLVALKSRVRQSASNLLLVMIKVREKKEMFGYWWALLPDSPEPQNWSMEGSSKKTLAYCAVTDPIAASRASALSVVLALLSGSRNYLSQAETSKKETTSFIPFSITLGYTITCMHKVLIDILDTEKSHSVIIVALKCCAALVQATPYHKMGEGLISDIVKSTLKFLVHRNVTLRVGALITMGCIISIDPRVDEVMKAIQKDLPLNITYKQTVKSDDECDDFEEGYSDDETCIDEQIDENIDEQIDTTGGDGENDEHYFRSWILDICFSNIGWMFKGNEIIRCKPSVIPVMLESLQVLSAIAFHYLYELLHCHIMLLGDVLCEMLQHEHQDVVLQAARTVSIIGDAIQKLDQTDQSPPLSHCVYMWEKLLTPLSTILQCYDNAPAKAVVCDCIANIGVKSFNELPARRQVSCCTLVMGSCGDEEAGVRAAAVRALAMTLMYNTLRRDISFVCDCGENILRALAEPTLVVRTKAAWALGNLSDALVLNMEEPDLDDIGDDLLYRLLDVSVKCVTDNDKVKMSATRSLGNLLRLIKEENLVRNPRLKPLCETAIAKLLDCACKVTNMKVRWNACYAIGNAMKNDHLYTCFTGWQDEVFPSLCMLMQECKNLKVRITAAVALRSPHNRSQYGPHAAALCRALLRAVDAACNTHHCAQYKHKDNLIEQLYVSLAHVCSLLTQEDLAEVCEFVSCYAWPQRAVLPALPPEHPAPRAAARAATHLRALRPHTHTQAAALSVLHDIFILDI